MAGQIVETSPNSVGFFVCVVFLCVCLLTQECHIIHEVHFKCLTNVVSLSIRVCRAFKSMLFEERWIERKNAVKIWLTRICSYLSGIL